MSTRSIKGMRVKTIQILTAAGMLFLALLPVRAEQPRNSPTLNHREEHTDMANEKIIMLIEAKILPEHHANLIEAARQYLPLVRAEPGVEAFYITSRKDDPDTIVFYEVYKSQAAQDSHLQQDFTKKFLAILKSAQTGDRVRTNLVDFVP